MAVRKRRRLGIGPASRGTKIDAWMRSSGTDARDSEPRTKNRVLIDRLHITPWFSGSADGAEQRLRPQRLEAEQPVQR